MPSVNQVIDALRPVEDPELRRSIVDLGMVRNVDISRKGDVAVLIALTVAGCPLRAEIQSRVTGAIQPLPGVRAVSLEFTVMTDQEREDLRIKLHGNPDAHADHTHAQG